MKTLYKQSNLFLLNLNSIKKHQFQTGFLLLFFCVFFMACKENQVENKPVKQNVNSSDKEEIHISKKKAEALNLKIGVVKKRNISGFVEANGRLEVPPQNEASLSSVVGATIHSINVIEGDEVKKGQTLAYLTHPNLIEMQSNYLEAYNHKSYLLQEKERQKKLYDAGVGSGKNYQKAQSDFQKNDAILSGLKAKLRLLNISIQKIEQGEIQERVQVKSPIDGYIQKVNIKTGQFVEAQTHLFDIINTHHIHADLMVYENDISKIEKGQHIKFNVQSLPNKELSAEIYSIGKTFEEQPKAVHVHAEIKGNKENLLPGMYIQGRIETDNQQNYALPEDAIVREGDRYYIFKAEEKNEEWFFEPVEIKTLQSQSGWTAIAFLNKKDEKATYAFNNAYYLLAESQKEEGGHHH
ncbi:efflux RND transporter periplasmic adaptor subunit [Mesonia aquimarina]|uniref:efflux RND transporter periplasmic adaptor subunit n=1 Tax=Mesonia aquimarina TaxID=1504967 RepID=UPI000EF5A04B|nr:efflux RND transporter periplasmic adaptor subunit [Mesonia aquimarina]